ncbi:MAG TPA: hypothetical protein VMH89_09380 [Candidatus Acidoferrum sp.]|nr:hypothetical protein [Candidatus Acidoferrum sp.]
MIEMPKVVTHRYDPAQGAGLNLCSLSDFNASLVLDRLRRESRPTLKPNYRARRRATEGWLSEAARKLLKQSFAGEPVYFFLGDFSYWGDPSRPAALVLPLDKLPVAAMTFTLGDSMTVAEEPGRRVYNFEQMAALFCQGELVSRFGFSDRSGFQTHFIEAQLWDKSALPVPEDYLRTMSFL